jgi:hypothetical protein
MHSFQEEFAGAFKADRLAIKGKSSSRNGLTHFFFAHDSAFLFMMGSTS